MALPTKLTLNIVTPDQSFAHEVDEVSLPGRRRRLRRAARAHAVLLGAAHRPDVVPQGRREALPGGVGGFVEVLPDRVTVIAQVAERAEDLDQARAEAGMKRAEEMLGADAARDGLRARAAGAAADAAAAAGRSRGAACDGRGLA